MAISAQGLPVHPGMRDRRQHLLPVGAHEVRHNSGRCNLDQQHMIQPNAVEGVFQRQHALNFMGLDHRFQNSLHGQGRFTVRYPFLREIIGYRQNPAQVIRWMSPLCSKPGIVVIQPADHAADVPGRFYGIQTIRSAGNPSAMRHHGALHYRTKMFGTFRKAQGKEPTTQGVEQAIVRSLPSFFRFDAVIANVVDNVLNDLVVIGSQILIGIAGHGRRLPG